MKKLLLLSLLFVFCVIYLISSRVTHKSSLSTIEKKELYEVQKEKIKDEANEIPDETPIPLLIMNGMKLAYDNDKNTFYYPISQKNENKSILLNIKLKEGFNYRIIDEISNKIKVDYNKVYKIEIFNDTEYYETNLVFTNIPTIQIFSDQTIGERVNAKMYLNDFNSSDGTFKSNIKINTRGGSSQKFDKKSYRVRFFNDDYSQTSSNNLLNIGNLNSYILDSLYSDPSKIRNILSSKLWNDISRGTSKYNIGLRCEFVEVFVNNEYRGLYTLKEPIGRKKLKLNKTTEKDTSVIIKAFDYIKINTEMDFSNITSPTFVNYEIRYPNEVELYQKSWNKILPILARYFDENVKNTDEVILSTFNINNYINYKIFITYINNVDNYMTNNTFFYLNSLDDDLVQAVPWDMDQSFGLYWDSESPTLTYEKPNSFVEDHWRMKEPYAPKVNNLIKNRYHYLKQRILNKRNFDYMLDEYKEKLSKGSTRRDSEKWYSYEIDEEIEKIRVWIYNRIEYWDSIWRH